jgi:hypothetical protein
MEAHRVEYALDVVGIVALLEQGEGDPPRVAPRGGKRRLGELRFRPLGVRDLDVAREPAEVAAIHGRDVATYRDIAVAVVAGEVELGETLERAHDRRTGAVALAEPQCVAGVGDRELETAGLTVEAIGEVPEEQERSGSHAAGARSSPRYAVPASQSTRATLRQTRITGNAGSGAVQQPSSDVVMWRFGSERA